MFYIVTVPDKYNPKYLLGKNLVSSRLNAGIYDGPSAVRRAVRRLFSVNDQVQEVQYEPHNLYMHPDIEPKTLRRPL